MPKPDLDATADGRIRRRGGSGEVHIGAAMRNTTPKMLPRLASPCFDEIKT
ncbi:hypothetical protein OHA98_21855 [Streptomyces sp. NBC_00654]|uniref:hypothetical protein n=1 Tax=Streptomyces sp. NBC_00654 TaxID=2975799 RepID=UPI0022567E07|nr:hypothetical protein [Streptomyces sp. NBC_00654]MCX4967361.1 hypothetical protein [Streptomyces sp. NBC_00654]